MSPTSATRASIPAVMLAHQGGWDEVLFVAVPLAIFFLLLRVAKKRAEAEGRAPDDDE